MFHDPMKCKKNSKDNQNRERYDNPYTETNIVPTASQKKDIVIHQLELKVKQLQDDIESNEVRIDALLRSEDLALMNRYVMKVNRLDHLKRQNELLMLSEPVYEMKEQAKNQKIINNLRMAIGKQTMKNEENEVIKYLNEKVITYGNYRKIQSMTDKVNKLTEIWASKEQELEDLNRKIKIIDEYKSTKSASQVKLDNLKSCFFDFIMGRNEKIGSGKNLIRLIKSAGYDDKHLSEIVFALNLYKAKSDANMLTSGKMNNDYVFNLKMSENVCRSLEEGDEDETGIVPTPRSSLPVEKKTSTRAKGSRDELTVSAVRTTGSHEEVTVQSRRLRDGNDRCLTYVICRNPKRNKYTRTSSTSNDDRDRKGLRYLESSMTLNKLTSSKRNN